MATPERKIYVIGVGTPAPDFLKGKPEGDFANEVRSVSDGKIIIFKEKDHSRKDGWFRYGIVEVSLQTPMFELTSVIKAEVKHLDCGEILCAHQMPCASDLLERGLRALPQIDDK